MSRITQYFKQSHIRILLLLIILDLTATICWYCFFGIEEANPLLSAQIKDSPAKFVLIKLGLSLPGLYLLNKYINKRIAQGGIAILLLCYSIVAVIHGLIFIMVL
jgi:hypothetical protein